MKAIVYNNSVTNVPRLVNDFHVGLEKGYAYETEFHFIHFYGTNEYFYGIHTGQTVIEKKQTSKYKSLTEWVEFYFGAKNILQVQSEIGKVTEGVWKPALYYYDDTYKFLKTNEVERRLCEQALRVLLEKLDDLLLYIEPDLNSYKVYSHKIRELLILACTEVENLWSDYMKISNTVPIGRNYTTKDYVKLKNHLFLKEFTFTYRSSSHLPPIIPFKNWDESNPTKSLKWYDGYNKTKHNRNENFDSANLQNAINAVVASLILYINRFSPYPLLEERGYFNSLVNQHFKFEMFDVDCTKSYIPLLKIPDNYGDDIFIYDSRRDVQDFTTNSFVL